MRRALLGLALILSALLLCLGVASAVLLIPVGMHCEDVYAGPEFPSPDGRFVAQVTTRDCGGATTSYRTQVIIKDVASGKSSTVLTYPHAGQNVSLAWESQTHLTTSRPAPTSDWEISRTKEAATWEDIEIDHFTYESQ